MPGWQQMLLQAWSERGLLARMLWPVSQVYRALFALRRWLYRQRVLPVRALPVPVVVVGNLVVGGAGKTPVTIALVEHLKARGWRVGVVARGHGRKAGGIVEVRADSPPAQAGDEPVLVARRTGVPVVVGRSRGDAALHLLDRFPETQVLLADDGLQHLAMRRDLEVCVFDDRGLGNGWLLPAGPLREAWPRAVDLVLHTGDRPAFAGGRAHRRLADSAVRADGTRRRLDSFSGERVTALAGIARPEQFFAMLQAAGLELTSTLALPDHYDFDSAPRLFDEGQQLLCTEKDAVKLWARLPQAWAVPLELTLEPAWQAQFDALLDAKLSSRDGSETS